ncbi:hypothetical protein HMPREF9412_0928 [Paenibacillus sp. HGF5]|nr:hypothetical protein HMPREF9412_0928 [Paenibacillus sp. HGF5]
MYLKVIRPSLFNPHPSVQYMIRLGKIAYLKRKNDPINGIVVCSFDCWPS